MAISEEEQGVKQERTPLWSVKASDRALFNGCSVLIFIIAIAAEIVTRWPICWQPLTKTAKDMIQLAALSMIGAYFIVEAKDMLGGITDWVKERNRRIRQEHQDIQEKKPAIRKVG